MDKKESKKIIKFWKNQNEYRNQKAKVGILNYKCGNINSIISVFDHLNSETIILKIAYQKILKI